MTVIDLCNVSCEKQNRQLFSDLNVSVDAGELLFLRGENGAGKTSLLRILVGLSTPQTGRVVFLGESIAHRDDLLSQLIYIGHKSGNSPSLSALANLRFWCAQFNITADDSRLHEILSLLHLDGLEDLPVRYLSAGQQRRVALAKLWLHSQAKLWVLDEPFTALDAGSVEMLCQHIAEFVKQGGCVVMTSHQQASIECNTKTLELEYRW